MAEREIRYTIQFAKEAFEEYQDLDRSVARIVDKQKTGHIRLFFWIGLRIIAG